MDTSPCIKEVVRSASVAFAPDAPFLVAGTMAGAVDMSFSSSANLEIFQLDFQSDDRKLPLVGAVSSPEPFNRLSWGKSPSSGSEDFSLGLVAGGLVDGNIGIWNPRLLIGSSEESESSVVQTLSRHRGPVRGLEFSSLSPNHLASGAEEGDICIWDIAKPAEPTHFPPLKGSGSATQGEISFLSWNKKVQPILASTSFNGTTVVWDLRKQKPIISFSDSDRRRCSVLQWHPDFATQLIVASDDDSSPSLRIWDMRNTMSPLRELVGHTKGVVAMSWCPIDSTYLLTCAKDNRTICWDTNSAEIVSELPAGTNWNFDVHWYPKIPGVISASSFDGKIGIYNIEDFAKAVMGARWKSKGSEVKALANPISKPVSSFCQDFAKAVMGARWKAKGSEVKALANPISKSVLSLQSSLIKSNSHGILSGCSVLLASNPEQAELLNQTCFGRPVITVDNDKKKHWFQFTLEEAFFLCYSLKCMKIVDGDHNIKTNNELWEYMVSRKASFPYFFKAYSHLQIKNWVVRSGCQYGVDFVAYRHHPSLVHSEFGVLVFADGNGNDRLRVWSDFQCMLRLCGSVAKTLLNLHVNRVGENVIDSSPSCLDGFSVDAQTITRWSPERCREAQAVK